MKQRKSTLLAATFLASLVLVACQSQQAQPTQESSSSHSIVAKQADKVVTKEDKSSPKGTAKPYQETVQTEQTPTTEMTKSTLDLQSMGQGDYSSLAGTWSDADGNQFIIDAQGNVTSVHGGTSQEGYTIQVTDASGSFLSAGLLAPNGSAVGSFMVIPAGVATPNLGEVYDTDVICSGQSALAEKNPYRK